MRVGFISTRFAGTDGVSLEACKWAEVLEQNGHPCFWFAGELQRPPEKSFLVPEAHFNHEQNERIAAQVLGRRERSPMLTRAIHSLRARLKIDEPVKSQDLSQRSHQSSLCELPPSLYELRRTRRRTRRPQR